MSNHTPSTGANIVHTACQHCVRLNDTCHGVYTDNDTCPDLPGTTDDVRPLHELPYDSTAE